MIGTPNTITCAVCGGYGVRQRSANTWTNNGKQMVPTKFNRHMQTCGTCRGFGFCIDSELTIGFEKQFISVPEWQGKEIERLYRKGFV